MLNKLKRKRSRYMCWEQLFAFSDNPLDIPTPTPYSLFNTIDTYILKDRQATDARTTEQYQQQQQNSINIHLVTILAGSLEWPEGDLAKDGVSQGGSQAPQVGR